MLRFMIGTIFLCAAPSLAYADAVQDLTHTEDYWLNMGKLWLGLSYALSLIAVVSSVLIAALVATNVDKRVVIIVGLIPGFATGINATFAPQEKASAFLSAFRLMHGARLDYDIAKDENEKVKALRTWRQNYDIGEKIVSDIETSTTSGTSNINKPQPTTGTSTTTLNN